MGKIKQGILGGFNGTTGAVVGASWKGIAYMRGKAQSIANPRTQEQTRIRTKFGVVSDYCSQIKSIIDDGFKSHAVKQSPFNAAVKANMLVSGSFEMSNFIIAKGGEVPPAGGSVGTVTSTTYQATINIPFYPGLGYSLKVVTLFTLDSVDALVPFVGNVVLQEGTVSYTYSGSIPSGMDYYRFDVYAYMVNNSDGQVSDSVYIGEYIKE